MALALLADYRLFLRCKCPALVLYFPSGSGCRRAPSIAGIVDSSSLFLSVSIRTSFNHGGGGGTFPSGPFLETPRRALVEKGGVPLRPPYGSRVSLPPVEINFIGFVILGLAICSGNNSVFRFNGSTFVNFGKQFFFDKQMYPDTLELNFEQWRGPRAET